MMWSAMQIPWDLSLRGRAPPFKIQLLLVFGGQIWQGLCLERSLPPGLPRTGAQEAQLLAPRKENSVETHPSELPAGQAQPGTWPETIPLPLLFWPLPYQLLLERCP